MRILKHLSQIERLIKAANKMPILKAHSIETDYSFQFFFFFLISVLSSAISLSVLLHLMLTELGKKDSITDYHK